MQERFFVSRNGTEMGPFTVDQIIEKVRAQELGAADFLYDEIKSDWILLLESSYVAERLRHQKPKSAPSKANGSSESPQGAAVPEVQNVETAPGQVEWYVLKGDNKFGPFFFLDLIRMLQEKVIFEFDYVWNGKMANWQRIAELADFGPDSIKKLITEKKVEGANVFYRRRHRRVKLSG